MRTLHQIAASQLGVGVWYQKGYEMKGILFTPPSEYERSEALSAQCSNCHTIVWITGRSDPILFKEKPNNQESYHDHNRRFLKSLPACPHCHQQAYDLFINNLVVPRYQNGDDPLLDKEENGVNEEMSAKVKDKAVWWYGDEAEAKRLNLHFL
ncbi:MULTISPECIES: hypothetical protein [Acinetobacter]|uniref:hypothetical protein n=1 Tax=Acinetobacter TaxID=469 RepID=UPI0002CF4B48|nr:MULTISPECIES: hypothetical protein [Acinetobacter]ENX57385.1 hypothetical protein F885_03544 [Acinetobacter higginsii]MCH7318604.1 hypothetical protein [Acinetobacter higginsii]